MSDPQTARAHATIVLGLMPMALWVALAKVLVVRGWLDLGSFFCLMGIGAFSYLCAFIVSGFTAIREIRRSASPGVATWLLAFTTFVVVASPWLGWMQRWIWR